MSIYKPINVKMQPKKMMPAKPNQNLMRVYKNVDFGSDLGADFQV